VFSVAAMPGATAGSTASAATPTPSGTTSSQSSGAKPDLVARAIRINGQAPDGKNDCKAGQSTITVTVKNAGRGAAGGFGVRLTVDGSDLDASVDALDAGQEREVRFDGVSLKKGEHTLKATVDAAQAIAETNDENNDLKVSARCSDAG